MIKNLTKIIEIRTLGESLLGNMLKGKYVIRTDFEVIRADDGVDSSGQDF